MLLTSLVFNPVPTPTIEKFISPKYLLLYKKIKNSASSVFTIRFSLENFKNKYNKTHNRIVKKVHDFMQYLEPLFELPQEIRKCIYTSNAVESVNSALRKVTRGKGAFPSESSVFKVLYLKILIIK